MGSDPSWVARARWRRDGAGRTIPPDSRALNTNLQLRILVISTAWLAMLATVTVAYVARGPILALAYALLIQIVLEPLVRRLATVLPRPAAATAITLAVVGMLVIAGYLVADPLQAAIKDLPSNLTTVREEITALRAPLEEAKETAAIIDEMAAVDDAPVPVVEVRQPTWLESLLSDAGNLAVYSLLTIFLGILLLARDSPVFAGFALTRRKRWERRARIAGERVRRQVSRYLRLTLLINLGLGTITALAMWAFEMPNPLMWGMLAGLGNFVPYLGSVVVSALILIAGIIEFGSLVTGCLPALAYLALTSVEGQLITPILLGTGLSLNPAVILIMVVAMGWIWGIPGVLLAVPMTLAVKTLAPLIKAWAGGDRHPTRYSLARK